MALLHLAEKQSSNSGNSQYHLTHILALMFLTKKWRAAPACVMAGRYMTATVDFAPFETVNSVSTKGPVITLEIQKHHSKRPCIVLPALFR